MYQFPTHSLHAGKKKDIRPDIEKKKEADAKAAEKALPRENKSEKSRLREYDPNIIRDHRGMWF